MRVWVARAATLLGVVAGLSGCVPPAPGTAAGPGPIPGIGGPIFTVARVDPEDAADRTIKGSILGAALGTGIGTTTAISASVGAIIGVETGAVVGAAIGAATAQPLPDYKPIAVPTAAVIPKFYDTWPPGYHMPPEAAQAPPPPG